MNVKKNDLKIIIFVTVVAVLFISCAHDTEIKPPETNIEKIQSVYGRTGVDIVLNGKDDKTPSEKLTYEYTIFKLSGENEALLYNNKIQENLISFDSDRFKEGLYRIKAVAINEFGIKDKTPAESIFKVDLTPPEVPGISYILKNGKIYFGCSEDEDHSDVAGYEMEISDSRDSQAFSSTEYDFVFSAEKGESYTLRIKAIDYAGNYSEKKELKIETDEDHAPVLDSTIPLLLGENDKKIRFDIYDDWDSVEMITCEATLSGLPLEIKEDWLYFDLSTINEGTHTLFIAMKDKSDNNVEIKKDLFIDLTPPNIPQNCRLKEHGKEYVITWNSSFDEKQTYKIYGFNKEEELNFLSDSEINSYKTDKRYLHYVVSGVDRAGNESSTSYPLRTYNEKYIPVTSSHIEQLKENTLLTSLYSPYRIDSGLIVPEGLMLGIEKGVEIIFENEGSLKISGQLISIPSNSEKKRIIKTEFSEDFDKKDHVVVIDGGSVWLNDFEIFGDENSDLFVIKAGGELRAQDITVKGFDNFIRSIDSEMIFMDNSTIETNHFATGTDCSNIKLNKMAIKSVTGIKIMNITSLEIDGSAFESEQFALQLDGFSNAILNQTRFYGNDAIIMNKLSAADAKNIIAIGKNSAISLRGASTLNLRNSTVSATNTAIYVDRSAYLCAIESTITNSEVGIFTMNSDIVLKDVEISGNTVGVKSKMEVINEDDFNTNRDR
jgi:hypothetical protein